MLESDEVGDVQESEVDYLISHRCQGGHDVYYQSDPIMVVIESSQMYSTLTLSSRLVDDPRSFLERVDLRALQRRSDVNVIDSSPPQAFAPRSHFAAAAHSFASETREVWTTH